MAGGPGGVAVGGDTSWGLEQADAALAIEAAHRAARTFTCQRYTKTTAAGAVARRLGYAAAMPYALVTREPERAAPYCAALARLGLRALAMPVTAIAELAPAELAAELAALHPDEVVALASARGAEVVARALGGRTLAPGQLWAVGEATAAPLRRAGHVVQVAHDASASGLAAAILATRAGAGLRVLLPRAAEGREEAARTLREAGAEVRELEVYRSIPAPPTSPELAEPLARWAAGEVAVLAVFAPSQVAALVELAARAGRAFAAPGVLFAAVGETTAGALRSAGVRELVVAERPTPEAMAKAVATRYPREP